MEQENGDRLEREYVKSRPALEKIVNEAVAKHAKVEGAGEEDDEPSSPDEWDGLTGSTQEEAKEAYTKENYQSITTVRNRTGMKTVTRWMMQNFKSRTTSTRIMDRITMRGPLMPCLIISNSVMKTNCRGYRTLSSNCLMR
jgi:hypothetical protein